MNRSFMEFPIPQVLPPIIDRCRSMRIEKSIYEGNRYVMTTCDSLHLVDYRARILHGEVQLILRPGDWIYTPRGHRFEYLELDSGSHHYYHYNLSGKRGSVEKMAFHGNLGQEFLSYWNYSDGVIQDFDRYGSSNQVVANYGFFVLLNRLIARSREIGYSGNNKSPRRSDYLVGEITNQLNRALGSPVDVTEICLKYKISPSYLNKCFRSKFGLSVSQYHMDKRLNYACELISKTTLPFKKIAEETGFYDYHHFNKKMRQHLGMNPSTYRAEHFEEGGVDATLDAQ